MAALMLFSVFSVMSASAVKQFGTTGTVGDCKWTYYNAFNELRITGGTEIRIDENNKYPWSSWENVKTIKKLVIGDGIKIIRGEAFSEFSGLTSVTLPDTLESIGYNVFYHCGKLESITLPKSLKEIGNAAFYGAGLKSVNIPESVKRIGPVAFACDNLTEVIFPDGIETLVVQYAFRASPKMKEVYIPSSITAIDEYAFGYYYDSEKDEAIKVNGFTIYTQKNSAAETYAKDNGFNYKAVSVIRDWKVTGIKNLTYTGKPLKQSNILVSKNGKYAEFTTNYKNNLNVGTATITIKGKGDYYGTINKTFKINKAANPVKVKAQKTVTAKANKKTIIKKAITVKNAQGLLTFKTNNKKVKIKNDKIHLGDGRMIISKGLKKGKTYTVKVTVAAKGSANYKSGSKTVKVKIKVK